MKWAIPGKYSGSLFALYQFLSYFFRLLLASRWVVSSTPDLARFDDADDSRVVVFLYTSCKLEMSLESWVLPYSSHQSSIVCSGQIASGIICTCMIWAQVVCWRGLWSPNLNHFTKMGCSLSTFKIQNDLKHVVVCANIKKIKNRTCCLSTFKLKSIQNDLNVV